MKNVILSCLNSFCNLLFPPHCLHCHSAVKNANFILCEDCISKMELIDPLERCPSCFSIEYCQERKKCSDCQPGESGFKKMAAAFDYLGPPATIIRKLKYGNQPYLAKSAAAYLVAQFVKLDWPMPDLIIPVPISFMHLIERGYNQSLLIAEGVSRLLNKPINSPLQRLSGDYSQAGLNFKQRASLKATTLRLRKNHHIYDKRILLIDDVMTTGSTLQKCAEILYEGFPLEIYALTLCKAVRLR